MYVYFTFMYGRAISGCGLAGKKFKSSDAILSRAREKYSRQKSFYMGESKQTTPSIRHLWNELNECVHFFFTFVRTVLKHALDNCR